MPSWRRVLGKETKETTLAEIDRDSGFPGLAGVLAGLHQERPSGVCPACGWTRARFRETGLFGCGLCVGIFSRKRES